MADHRVAFVTRCMAVSLLATLLLSGCSSEPSSADPGEIGGGELTGVTWVLDRPSMRTLTHESAPADARIDIVFDGSRVGGHAACNSYFGSYTADEGDGTLAFSELGSTQKACDDSLMQLESAYLTALSKFTTYVVVGDQFGLVLLGGNTSVTFSPETH